MSHLNRFLQRSFLHAAMAAACFLMLVSVCPMLSGAATTGIPASSAAPSQGPPRSSPESQGISSADILAFVQAADEQIDAMNSFMLVRHGRVVAEAWWAPYDAD